MGKTTKATWCLRITAFMTAVLLTLSFSLVSVNIYADNSTLASREYIVSEFVQSVGRNNLTGSDYILSTFTDSSSINEQYKSDISKAAANGIVRGYEDKTIRPTENVSRLEAMVMYSRIIPSSVEETAEPIVFSDVPDWAKSDIDALSAKGLVLGYGDGNLGADDSITEEQVKILTDRSDDLFNSTTPGKSFYGYINNKSFRNCDIDTKSVINSDYGAIVVPNGSWSAVGDAALNTNNLEMELLKKLMNGELQYENGSAEQRIHDMLLCIDDNNKNATPDQNYDLFKSMTDKINACKDIDSLMQAACDIYLTTGINPVLNAEAGLDPNDHSVHPAVKMTINNTGGLLAFDKNKNTDAYQAAYSKEISNYLNTIGYSFSASDIKNAIGIQGDIAEGTNYLSSFYIILNYKKTLDPNYTEEKLNAELDALAEQHPELIENDQIVDTSEWVDVVSKSDAQKAYSDYDITKALSSYGYPETDQYILPRKTILDKQKNLFGKNNVDALKVNAMLQLAYAFGCYKTEEESKQLNMVNNFGLLSILSDNVDDIDVIYEKMNTIDNNSTDTVQTTESEDGDTILTTANINAFSQLLPNDMGLMYCKYYYDDEDSEVIANMLTDIWNEYLKEFSESDWLSDATKTNASKKIENMVAVIGYPDNYDFPDIVPPSDGGTYFSNMVNIRLDNLNTSIKSCKDQEFVRTSMLMPPDMWNACYIPQLNIMNIPAGIINMPAYDKNASYATNLGAMGVIIGHEVGHAFDSTGSKYDENGCLKNWWTDEDALAFKQKQNKFVKYYSHFGVTDKVTQDSNVTITENMADIAGIQCVFSIIGDDKAAQKEALESYARLWAKLGTEAELTSEAYMQDVHSAGQVRVNAAVASLDCFYDIYNIKEGDPMYVAPEDRLTLWK